MKSLYLAVASVLLLTGAASAHPDVKKAVDEANKSFSQGQFDKSETHYRKAIDMAAKFGEPEPVVDSLKLSLAAALLRGQKDKLAIPIFVEVKEHFAKRATKDRTVNKDPSYFNLLGALANCYAMQKQYAQAEKVYVELLALPVDKRALALYRLKLAHMYLNKGDPAKARETFQAVSTDSQFSTSPNLEAWYRAECMLAKGYLLDGKFEQSEEHCKLAAGLQKRLTLTNPEGEAILLSLLGQTLSGQKKYKEAIAVFESARPKFKAIGKNKETTDYVQKYSEALVKSGAPEQAARVKSEFQKFL